MLINDKWHPPHSREKKIKISVIGSERCRIDVVRPANKNSSNRIPSNSNAKLKENLQYRRTYNIFSAIHGK